MNTMESKAIKTASKVMVEIHCPSGEVWIVRENGELSGFPFGSVVKTKLCPDAIIYPVDSQAD